ncbi:MAG: twin-arginine translocation signal domain-containing protein, partial [Acidobacteria bacterium]|nr:twin-arginine translocation signal domain-containing protein [Acidobacteriota bacterium]
MQEDNGQVNRRTFLKLSGAAMAAASSNALWAEPQEAGASVTRREQPKNPIVIESDYLRVELDPQHGLPYRYSVPRRNWSILGEDLGKPILVTVCHKPTWTFRTIPARVSAGSPQESAVACLFI